MATWESGSFLPFGDSMKSGLEAVGSAASLLGTGLGIVKSALGTVEALLPSAVLSADGLVRAAAELALASTTGVLLSGVYVLPLGPMKMDWGRSQIEVWIAEREAKLARLQTVYRTFEEARSPQQARALSDRGRTLSQQIADLEVELADLRRRRYFQVPSALRMNHDWSAIQGILRESLADLGDKQRPTFDGHSVVTGAVFLVGSDSLPEFAELVRSMAAWLGQKRLSRQADTIAKLAATTSGRAVTTPGASSPPDWRSLHLAQALGLDEWVRSLQRYAGSLGVSTIASNSTAKSLLEWLGTATAAMQEAVDGGQIILRAMQALAALSGNAHMLFVPPWEGEVDVEGLKIPAFTAGIDGFLASLAKSQRPPADKWLAGLCILGGFPVGANLATLDAATYRSPAVQATIAQAEKLYRTLRGTP